MSLISSGVVLNFLITLVHTHICWIFPFIITSISSDYICFFRIFNHTQNKKTIIFFHQGLLYPNIFFRKLEKDLNFSLHHKE